ncbi:MAG: HIT family protein [Nanoarchaeota archaeon]|nr:HIT family protein [Nanoarchaeota archaeon]
MEDCIFCKIANGIIPSSKVYEDEDIFAFLDIAPLNKGHTLVIPKKHFNEIYQMPDNLLGKLFSVVKKIACALKQDNDGVNILQNNGKAAGQVVGHVHVHLIPRKDNDNVNLGSWKTKEYQENEIKQYQDKIKNFLKNN